MKADAGIYQAAIDAAPEADPELIRNAVDAALGAVAQSIFVQDQGREIREGKTHYPDGLVVHITDPYRGLDTVQQLQTACVNTLRQNKDTMDCHLYFPGEMTLSDE